MKCKECRIIEMRVIKVDDTDITYQCPKCSKEEKTAIKDIEDKEAE